MLNSGVALAVNNVVKEKNSIMLNSGAGSSELTNSQCTPNTIHTTYDTYMLAHSTGSAMVKASGVPKRATMRPQKITAGDAAVAVNCR